MKWKHVLNAVAGFVLLFGLYAFSIFPVQTLANNLHKRGKWGSKHQEVWNLVYTPYVRIVEASPRPAQEVYNRLLDVFDDLGQ